LLNYHSTIINGIIMKKDKILTKISEALDFEAELLLLGEKPLKDGQEKRQLTLAEDSKSINNMYFKK